MVTSETTMYSAPDSGLAAGTPGSSPSQARRERRVLLEMAGLLLVATALFKLSGWLQLRVEPTHGERAARLIREGFFFLNAAFPPSVWLLAAYRLGPPHKTPVQRVSLAALRLMFAGALLLAMVWAVKIALFFL